jgi:hypothetical protein
MCDARMYVCVCYLIHYVFESMKFLNSNDKVSVNVPYSSNSCCLYVEFKSAVLSLILYE